MTIGDGHSASSFRKPRDMSARTTGSAAPSVESAAGDAQHRAFLAPSPCRPGAPAATSRLTGRPGEHHRRVLIGLRAQRVAHQRHRVGRVVQLRRRGIYRLAVGADFAERSRHHRRHGVGLLAVDASRSAAEFCLERNRREVGGEEPGDGIQERGVLQVEAAGAQRRHAHLLRREPNNIASARI